MSKNMPLLHRIAEVLLEKDQVDGEELLAMIFEAQTESYIQEDAKQTLPYREAVPA